MARDFVTNEFTKDPKDHNTLNDIRKTLVHRHVAWLHALTFQLRKLKDWEHQSNQDNGFRKKLGTDYHVDNFEQLKPYLSDEEYQYIMEKGNKASHLMSLQSRHLKELKRVGLIDSFPSYGISPIWLRKCIPYKENRSELKTSLSPANMPR